MLRETDVALFPNRCEGGTLLPLSTAIAATYHPGRRDRGGRQILRSDHRQATITKALSFMDWLDDFLYLPEAMYIIIFLWLISSGPGRLSIDHWIAVRSGLLDGVSADHSDCDGSGFLDSEIS